MIKWHLIIWDEHRINTKFYDTKGELVKIENDIDTRKQAINKLMDLNRNKGLTTTNYRIIELVPMLNKHKLEVRKCDTV
jgi:hypothetical protein